jgi:hypothetical protein
LLRRGAKNFWQPKKTSKVRRSAALSSYKHDIFQHSFVIDQNLVRCEIGATYSAGAKN